ncbi:hypothetical protein ACSMXN_09020 [Jatrophihabitans sp. DSM 45814]
MIDGPASDQWRDERALGRFELFLFTAVATVLVVRTALAVTGYPQVGGGGLHVAHVLWGGLLMGVAIVIVEILPGTRVRVRAAFIGGIGFGLFIDEIGKFLTKDVNYFFRPAVAIIYATFVFGYLIVREFIHRRKLDDSRRLALAATAVADLSLGQLDQHARQYALALLEGVDETSELREAALAVGKALRAQPPAKRSIETSLTQIRDRISMISAGLLGSALAQRLVLWISALIAIDIIVTVLASFIAADNVSFVRKSLDTGIPSLLSATLVIVGVVRLLSGHRQSGLRLIQTAVLMKVLFTEIVVFNREQWFGLVSFAFDLIVLAVIGIMLDPQPVPQAEGDVGSHDAGPAKPLSHRTAG